VRNCEYCGGGEGHSACCTRPTAKVRGWLTEAGYVAVVIALLPFWPLLPLVGRMMAPKPDPNRETLMEQSKRLTSIREHKTRCIEHSSTVCDRSVCKYECFPNDGCHEFPWVCTQEESCA